MRIRQRPDLTEKVKDAIVRDYLRGDKTIIIQMEYKISPGEMYRVLHAHQVELRRAPEPEEKLPTGNNHAESTCLIVDSHQLLPAGSGFRVAMWNLTLESWDWDMKTTFTKMAEVLAEYLDKEPVTTVEALGFLNQPFTPDQLLKSSLEMMIEHTLSYDPEFEHLTDGSWRIRKKEADMDESQDEEGVWVKDTCWVKLDEPKRCRSISGSPKTHCPNMAYFGFPRSNGIWAYCEEHMYGRRVRDGIVEIKVHPESPAAKRGYA